MAKLKACTVTSPQHYLTTGFQWMEQTSFWLCKIFKDHSFRKLGFFQYVFYVSKKYAFFKSLFQSKSSGIREACSRAGRAVPRSLLIVLVECQTFQGYFVPTFSTDGETVDNSFNSSFKFLTVLLFIIGWDLIKVSPDVAALFWTTDMFVCSDFCTSVQWSLTTSCETVGVWLVKWTP